VVAFEAPEDECLHGWLMYGGHARCMKISSPQRPDIEMQQVAMGWFPDSGPIVGVSDTPCSDGGCLKGAQICGRVDKSRDYWHYVEQGGGDGWQLGANAGLRNKYWVDCKGKAGKYVFVMLPGSGRILTITNLVVNQVSATAGDPQEFKNKFVCYPVEAREASEHTPEYIISDDPADPVFYSTCFIRTPNLFYLPPEDQSADTDPSKYEFMGQCLPCDLYKSNSNPGFGVPNRWAWADVCRDCDALKDSPGTCAAPKCSNN